MYYIKHKFDISNISLYPLFARKKSEVKSGSALINTELNDQNNRRSLDVHVEHAGHFYSLEARNLSTALR